MAIENLLISDALWGYQFGILFKSLRPCQLTLRALEANIVTLNDTLLFPRKYG
jgi:hypothetical protein